MEALQTLWKSYSVTRLALFGSVLREDFGPQSDVDVLVEFPPGEGPGLMGFASLEGQLTRLIGREVHLHSPAMLGPTYRAEVQHAALVQYAV